MIGSLESPHGIRLRLAELKRLSSVRNDRTGFATNVAEIKLTIKKAEARLLILSPPEE